MIANVGNLVRPVTREGLLAGTDPRPVQLFSHSDQLRQIQSADAIDLLQTGWGGRMADRLPGLNAGNIFPALSSLGDSRTFIQGQSSIPLSLPPFDFFSIFGTDDVQPAGAGSEKPVPAIKPAPERAIRSAAPSIDFAQVTARESALAFSASALSQTPQASSAAAAQ